MIKSLRCMAAAAILAATAAMTVWAADTKIDKVTISFSYVDEPKSGESIGSIDAKTSSGEFTIESAEFVNDNEVWSVGDRPLVRLELTAKDGYRFSYTSKSHFSLSGCSATFERAKTYDSGTMLELDVYLKRVGGKLSMVENLEWMGDTATWDELEGAKSYQVRLYREESLVTTVTTAATSFDFTGYYEKSGNYYFRVRAISDYNDKAGEWSDDSYDNEVEVSSVNAGGNSIGGRWLSNQYGWWYSYNNGDYPRSCWQHIGNVWYYFNSNGYMVTGWQQLGGTWYYLNSSGAMVTGWQHIDGKWYYFDGNGAMYANRRTPDGLYVDGSGAWVQG